MWFIWDLWGIEKETAKSFLCYMAIINIINIIIHLLLFTLLEFLQVKMELERIFLFIASAAIIVFFLDRHIFHHGLFRLPVYPISAWRGWWPENIVALMVWAFWSMIFWFVFIAMFMLAIVMPLYYLFWA